jgi:hypothetical protein
MMTQVVALRDREDHGPFLDMPALSAFQQSIWDSPKRNWLLFAGRRCGKTALAILRSIKVSVGNHGKVAWCAADTEQGMAGWDELVAYIKANLLDQCVRRDFVTNGVIEFVGGGSIKRISAWEANPKYKKGRGQTYHLLVLDEVQLMSQAFYRRIRPSLLTTRGAVVMTGTPPETPEEYEQAKWLREWMDDVIAGDREAGNWLITEKPTSAEDYAFFIQVEASNAGDDLSWNEAVDAAQEFIDEERDADPISFTREYEVKWIISREGRVYPEFSDAKHISDEYEFIPDLPHYVVIDRGEGDGWTVALFMQGFWTLDRKGRPVLGMRVFDEVSSKRVMSEAALIDACLTEPKGDYPMPKRWGYDTRAPGVGAALYDLSLPHVPCNVPIESGIRRVRRLMILETEQPMFQVHPKCKRLIHNMNNYKRKGDGKPDDRGMDGADAMRYGTDLIETENGISRKEAEQTKEIIAQMARREHNDTMAVGGVFEISLGF